MKEVNHIKVVLAEKNVLRNGFLNKSGRILLQYQNGALILSSQAWKLYWILPMLLK